VQYRFQPWQLALVVILLSAGAVVFTHWRHVSRPLSAVDLIQYLPADQATHVYIDINVLRNSGLLDLLAGSKAEEESDYRRFVEETRFDYRSDLDAVAAAFLHGDVYLVLRGRFDWKQLTNYAHAQGGSCRNAICVMTASTPDRHISFYPVKSDIMALAVSKQERGVDAIAPSKWSKAPRLPAEPVWISVPSAMFADSDNLPSETHSLLAPLAQTQEVTFAVGPKDQHLQVRLEVACSTPQAAAALTNELTSTTGLLKRMMEREHRTPNSRDLSGILVAGSFQQQDRIVTGTWPIERDFVEALANGRVP
jgi:hypothetical protein